MNTLMSILESVLESAQLSAFFWFCGAVIVISGLLGAVQSIHKFIEAARAKPGRAENDRLAKQFEALRFEVLTVSVINNYPVVLNKLRRFFLEHALVERPAFEEFFHEWLSHPVVDAGKEVLVPGLYAPSHLSRLEAQLRALQF